MQAACTQAEREQAARTLGDRSDVRRTARERVVCDRTQREHKFLQTIIVGPTILIYDINRYAIIPAVFLSDFLV